MALTLDLWSFVVNTRLVPELLVKSESRHVRLKVELIERIGQRMRVENRTFNNACETLLMEALEQWEQWMKVQKRLANG